MKTMIALVVVHFVLCSAGNGAAPPPRSTSYYVKSHAQELEGRLHRIRISIVRPGRVERPNQWFNVYTEGTEGSAGGWIEVLTDEPERFMSRYGYQLRWNAGLAIQSKRLRGVIRISESGVVYLDATVATVNVAGDDTDVESDDAEVEPPEIVRDDQRVRTWTSTDGRTIDAEFLSANTVMVKIRRTSDDRVFEFELAKLSQADRDWVAANR